MEFVRFPAYAPAFDVALFVVDNRLAARTSRLGTSATQPGVPPERHAKPSLRHRRHSHLRNVPRRRHSPVHIHGSRIHYALDAFGNGWRLLLADGTMLAFPDSEPVASPEQAALYGIRDRFGNVVTFDRPYDGILHKVTSSRGAWIAFTYDAMGRIVSATDDINRSMRYEYDDGGRLITVTDPDGGTTRYTASRYTAGVTIPSKRFANASRYHDQPPS